MTGYVDIQLNGCHGTDFNDDRLTAEAFHGCCLKLQAQGVRAFLPTITTDALDAMCRRLAKLAAFVAADPLARAMAPGFHVEGPMISPLPGFRGAHPAAGIIPASPDAARRLVEAGGGKVRIVTLAPECDAGCATIRWLANQGVRVAAGHTDASRDQLAAACDAGLSLFTHLGNGAPLLLTRHDNIIQRALSLRERLTLCFIADGVHIPLFVLANYLALAGCEHAIAVTDGIHAAGLGPGRHRTPWGDEVDVGPDLAVWAPDHSHLCGSALTMPQVEANLRTMGLTDAQIRQLICDNPARVAGV